MIRRKVPRLRKALWCAGTADALVVIGQGRLLAQTTVAQLSARSGSLEEAFFQLTGDVTDYPGRLS